MYIIMDTACACIHVITAIDQAPSNFGFYCSISIYISRSKAADGLIDEKYETLIHEELDLLNNCLLAVRLPLIELPIKVAYRAIWNNSVFYSIRYKRVKARNSYTVQWCTERVDLYGRILCFVSVHNSVFILMNQLKPLEAPHIVGSALNELTRSKIVPVTSGSKIFVPLPLRMHKCVHICIADADLQYVVTFPNEFLAD